MHSREESMLVVQKKYHHAAGHAFVLEDNKTVVVLRI